jgi:hypothetical protein
VVGKRVVKPFEVERDVHAAEEWSVFDEERDSENQ